MFISFEGPDGAGKTTQAGILAERLRSDGHDVVPIHEPGGTELGTDVRALLVRRGWAPIDPRAEALLFSACRAELVAEVIRPSLERGAIVVADRFADSTLAYQGSGRRLPNDQLKLLIEMATGGLEPDLTMLLDVPPAVGLGRLRAGTSGDAAPRAQLSFFEEIQLPLDWNRFEDEELDFHERVREAYLQMARAQPHRWRVIDATQPLAVVERAVWEEVGLALFRASSRT